MISPVSIYRVCVGVCVCVCVCFVFVVVVILQVSAQRLVVVCEVCALMAPASKAAALPHLHALSRLCITLSDPLPNGRKKEPVRASLGHAKCCWSSRKNVSVCLLLLLLLLLRSLAGRDKDDHSSPSSPREWRWHDDGCLSGSVGFEIVWTRR